MQLLCLGDVAIAEEGVTRQIWRPAQGMPSGDEVRTLFNCELPVADTLNPTPRSRGPRLLAHPDSVHAIGSLSPGFATLATNHILDAGEAGLAKTREALNRAGFATVGAGRTREEITSPLFWETAEGRLAIVNWVFPETHPDWMAVPGPNCWPGLEEARHTIQELGRKTDWLLAAVHWSDENFPYPRPEDRAIARELVQMGADLVIGHHPHVVRGMESIGACPVFYSIGNFYFSDFPDCPGGWNLRQAPRNHESLGIGVSFQAGKRPECHVLSLWQTKRRVVVDPLRRAVRRLERVSQPLRQLQEPGYTEWYTRERARFDSWPARWHFGVRKLGIGGLLRYLLLGKAQKAGRYE